MIRLYHCAAARSFRALWALEELGLSYELVLMPFPPRALYPDYRTLNPLGTVPVLFEKQLLITPPAGMAEYAIPPATAAIKAMAAPVKRKRRPCGTNRLIRILPSEKF